MAKTLTRAEMKQAAQLAARLNFSMIPTEMESWCIDQPGKCCCASMLMSEAYRPAGHDGDGKDD